MCLVTAKCIVMLTAGERLRWARSLVSSLSARELSRLAGQSETHVGQIEDGRVTNPGAYTVAALCEVMALSIDWVIHGGGAPPEPEAVRRAVAIARADAAAKALAESEPA